MKFTYPVDKGRRSLRAREVLALSEQTKLEFDPRADVSARFVEDMWEQMEGLIKSDDGSIRVGVALRLAEGMQYIRPEETSQFLRRDIDRLTLPTPSALDVVLLGALYRLYPEKVGEFRSLYQPKEADLTRRAYRAQVFSEEISLYPMMALALQDPSQRPKINAVLHEHISEINQRLKVLRGMLKRSDTWSAFAGWATQVILLAPELKEHLDISLSDLSIMKKNLKRTGPLINIYDVARVIQFLKIYNAKEVHMGEDGLVQITENTAPLKQPAPLPPRELV